MRALKIIIVLVTFIALYALLHTQESVQNKSYSSENSPSRPAPKAKQVVVQPQPGVTVAFDPRRGRSSMQILNAPVENSQQNQKDWLAPYRMPAAAPIAGAENFELLKLKAIPTRSFDPAMGEKIEDKFGFVIFAAPVRDFNLTTAESLPVVAKKGSGLLGIVTGTIIVTLKDASLAEGLAQSHNLELKFLDRDLKLAYFSAPAQSPLDQIAATLGASDGVEHVTLEVVQARKRL